MEDKTAGAIAVAIFAISVLVSLAVCFWRRYLGHRRAGLLGGDQVTFIGPKPEDTPKFATPFEVYDDQVQDANGVRVATANTPGYAYDDEMARAIADALNEKFGGQPEKTTVTAEAFSWRAESSPDNGGVWLVVNGKAYYRRGDLEIVQSIYTPYDLSSDGEMYYVGTTEIDPAALVGVVGRK